MNLFEDFAGNNEVLGALRRMFLQNRLVHAIILVGTAGLGKKTLARLISHAAVCSAEPGNAPCGKCPACVGASFGTNPDITEIAPKGRSIGVDQIRRLRADTFIMPNQSAKKCCIIPNAEQMTEQAQNALLKILEEPPEYALFILTCEYTHQLLDTVVSRSAVFTLGELDPEEASDFIVKRHPDYSKTDVEEAARIENGNIGRILTRLEGAGTAQLLANEIAAAVTAPSELTLLKQCAKMERDKGLQNETVRLLASAFRDALTLKSGASRSGGGEVSHTLAQQLTAAQLVRLIESADRAAHDLDCNIGSALFVTNLCACFRAAVDL